MNFKKESEGFKIYLVTLGYGKTTTKMLPSCLLDFLNFTSKEIEIITSKDITNYHKNLQERPNKRRSGGLSESYIHHHVYSLKLFFGWKESTEEIKKNPISSLTFESPKSKPREILTQIEIKHLYAVTQTFEERSVISLFYGCGLRRSEAEKLNLSDLHFRTNLLYVRAGKGSKRRAVPMSEKVKADLKNYVLEERKAELKQSAVIVNRIGTRMRGKSYSVVLKDLLRKANIEKEISLHSLRHSIATHLLENGLSVEYVRDFLGHKHLETTQIYTRISKTQLFNMNFKE